LKDEVINQLFPLQCFKCQAIGASACADCLKKEKAGQPFCLVCSKANFLGLTCPACLTKNSPRQLIVRFKYSGLVKKMITVAKYEDYQACLVEISQELAELIKKKLDINGLVVSSIPLSPARQRLRGFNQAEIIAKTIADCLDLEYRPFLRRKNQQSQVEANSRKARLQNIRGVFLLVSKQPIRSNVLLIDDVTTTGATLLEASRALKKVCKGKVICAVLAH